LKNKNKLRPNKKLSVFYNSCLKTFGSHLVRNNKKKNFGKCVPCSNFVNYTLAFAVQLRKKHGKTSVRVVEKCPSVPLAEIQYTFTHKQYTEPHSEREYTHCLYINFFSLL
jgi:hypothetical protein